MRGAESGEELPGQHRRRAGGEGPREGREAQPPLRGQDHGHEVAAGPDDAHAEVGGAFGGRGGGERRAQLGRAGAGEEGGRGRVAGEPVGERVADRGAVEGVLGARSGALREDPGSQDQRPGEARPRAGRGPGQDRLRHPGLVGRERGARLLSVATVRRGDGRGSGWGGGRVGAERGRGRWEGPQARRGDEEGRERDEPCGAPPPAQGSLHRGHRGLPTRTCSPGAEPGPTRASMRAQILALQGFHLLCPEGAADHHQELPVGEPTPERGLAGDARAARVREGADQRRRARLGPAPQALGQRRGYGTAAASHGSREARRGRACSQAGSLRCATSPSPVPVCVSFLRIHEARSGVPGPDCRAGRGCGAEAWEGGPRRCGVSRPATSGGATTSPGSSTCTGGPSSARLLLIASAQVFTRLGLPLPTLAVLLCGEVLANLGLWAVTRQGRATDAVIAAVMVADALVLTVVLDLTGGAANPFSTLYLVNVALAAVLLPPRWSWLILVASLGGFAGLFVHEHFAGPNHHIHPAMGIEGLIQTHLLGMWVALALASVFVVFFVQRLTLDAVGPRAGAAGDPEPRRPAREAGRPGHSGRGRRPRALHPALHHRHRGQGAAAVAQGLGEARGAVRPAARPRPDRPLPRDPRPDVRAVGRQHGRAVREHRRAAVDRAGALRPGRPRSRPGRGAAARGARRPSSGRPRRWPRPCAAC